MGQGRMAGLAAIMAVCLLSSIRAAEAPQARALTEADKEHSLRMQTVRELNAVKAELAAVKAELATAKAEIAKARKELAEAKGQPLPKGSAIAIGQTMDQVKRITDYFDGPVGSEENKQTYLVHQRFKAILVDFVDGKVVSFKLADNQPKPPGTRSPNIPPVLPPSRN